MSERAVIGDGNVAAVYELVVLDHVDFVDPSEYDVELEGVDPRNYFVTSGDAVEKAKVLEKDCWHLAGEARKLLINGIAKYKKCSHQKAVKLYREGKRPRKLSKLTDFEKAAWKVAGQSRKFVNVLKSVKAENCFLETEWDSHVLLCIPKNPRR